MSSGRRPKGALHTIALDGAWSEQGNELVFSGLGHLKTSEVGDVLERAVRRIERHLGRCGLLGTRNDDLDLSGEGDPECNLATSAVSGQSPPAGPQSPEGRLRAGRLDFSPSGPGHSPTTSRCAHHSMASHCTRPPAQAGSTPKVERHCSDMSCVPRSPRSEWSSSPTASWPEARLRAAHHPEEGLQ